jgi:hypothetical protein
MARLRALGERERDANALGGVDAQPIYLGVFGRPVADADREHLGEQRVAIEHRAPARSRCAGERLGQQAGEPYVERKRKPQLQRVPR